MYRSGIIFQTKNSAFFAEFFDLVNDRPTKTATQGDHKMTRPCTKPQKWTIFGPSLATAFGRPSAAFKRPIDRRAACDSADR